MPVDLCTEMSFHAARRCAQQNTVFSFSTRSHTHALGISTGAAAQTSRKEQGQIKERSLVRRKCVERFKARTGAARAHNPSWSKSDKGRLRAITKSHAYNVFFHNLFRGAVGYCSGEKRPSRFFFFFLPGLLQVTSDRQYPCRELRLHFGKNIPQCMPPFAVPHGRYTEPNIPRFPCVQHDERVLLQLLTYMHRQFG